MRFGWLAPLVPDTQVLDSQVLSTVAGSSGLGSVGGPTAPGANGMGPKVVRPRNVPGPVAEPVPGSEGGTSLHLRQGGETLLSVPFGGNSVFVPCRPITSSIQLRFCQGFDINLLIGRISTVEGKKVSFDLVT